MSAAAPAPPGDAERFFFVHLQKTAGTTLLLRLRHHFGASAVYPGPGDGDAPDNALLVEHLAARWRARRHEIRVVTGHFPLCTTEVLGAPFTAFTVLREPVERTLSLLRHRAKLDPEHPELTLEDRYAEPFAYHMLIHNHMVKMLGMTAQEMAAGASTHVQFTRAHLQRAKEQLEAIDAFGLQEHFEDFCAELARRYGWDLGPPRRTNRTDPVEVTDAFRERILDDNALDVELYEFARALHARRHAGV